MAEGKLQDGRHHLKHLLCGDAACRCFGQFLSNRENCSFKQSKAIQLHITLRTMAPAELEQGLPARTPIQDSWNQALTRGLYLLCMRHT